MNEISIRAATTGDIPTLAAFNIAMAAETEHKDLAPHLITPGVTDLVSNPNLGFYRVAQVDDAVAGCLAVTFEWSDWRNGMFWWIQSVYIHPDFRHRGVFRALYDRVTDEAKQDPTICGIRLYVEKDNVNAQQTYSRLGMVETDYKLFEVEFDRP